MTSINCISYNINGLNNPVKRKELLGQLKKMQVSIAFIQETHLSVTEHRKLKREWVDQVYSASCQRGRKRGVAILFNKSVYFIKEKEISDDQSRYVMVVGSITEIDLTFLNIYAPHEDCPNFFNDIVSLLAGNAK